MQNPDDAPNASGSATIAQSNSKVIKIGTRQSILALVQTNHVAKLLRDARPGTQCEVVGVSVLGDRDKKTALYAFNAKALWTSELEESLAAGQLDMVVHCLKDMPTQLPNDMAIGAILPREDPRDAFVIHPDIRSQHSSLDTLPAGSVIGTSSLRRIAQLRRLYPHLKFTDNRGNIDTRLAKLDKPDSGIAGLILAAAGLHRLDKHARITSYLSSRDKGIYYAVGQGALALETRSDDKATLQLLSEINHEPTMRLCLAERSLLRTLEGGCSVPIGVEAHWGREGAETLLSTDSAGVGVHPAAQYDKVTGQAIAGGETLHQDQAKVQSSGGAQDEQEPYSDELFMRSIVVSLDGKEAVTAELRRRVTDREQADEFGFDLARLLVERGADKILHEITLNRKIIESQGNA